MSVSMLVSKLQIEQLTDPRLRNTARGEVIRIFVTQGVHEELHILIVGYCDDSSLGASKFCAPLLSLATTTTTTSTVIFLSWDEESPIELF